MKRTIRTTILATFAALTAAACGPSEERGDQWAEDVPGFSEAGAHLETLRAEVEATLNELRDEIDQMREELRDEPNEHLTRVSAQVEQTRGEVLSELRRLETADMEEAHRIRERASERIAELEADVVRSELDGARDPGTLSEKVDGRLAELESDLIELERYVADRPRDPADEHAMERAREFPPEDRAAVARAPVQTLDREELGNLWEALMETREEAALISEGEFEDKREELSDRVAELTREVRKHWHSANWDRSV